MRGTRHIRIYRCYPAPVINQIPDLHAVVTWSKVKGQMRDAAGAAGVSVESAEGLLPAAGDAQAQAEKAATDATDAAAAAATAAAGTTAAITGPAAKPPRSCKFNVAVSQTNLQPPIAIAALLCSAH